MFLVEWELLGTKDDDDDDDDDDENIVWMQWVAMTDQLRTFRQIALVMMVMVTSMIMPMIVTLTYLRRDRSSNGPKLLLIHSLKHFISDNWYITQTLLHD